MPRAKLLAAALLALAFAAPSSPAKEPKDETASFDISGLGFLKNREVARTMEDFVNPGKVSWLSDDAAENAAFVLISELEERGYLHPKVEGLVTLLNGTKIPFEFDETLNIAFPRKAGTHVVAFKVERGVQSYIADVHFDGLDALSPEDAAEFFKPAYGLWSGKHANVFSQSTLRRGRNALLDVLLIRGYAGAQVDVSSSPIPDEKGAMRLDVKVRQGPRWVVSSFDLHDLANARTPAGLVDSFVGQPWSEGVRLDAAVAVRRDYYRAGYPDVSAKVVHKETPVAGGETQVAATVNVQPGPHIEIGEVRYEGNNRTRLSVIRRRVHLKTGDPLDPTAIDRARLRLGRLAAFDGVDARTEPAADGVRDVIFSFDESDPWEASVLFGYGSYEQFRAGVETRRSNLWGRAHQDRFLVVQSVKSTRAEYTYTVPELFGETIDGSARIFGFRREEVAFVRQEYGGTVQLRKKIRRRGPELTGGYTMERLSDRNNTLSATSEDTENVNSASLNLGIAFDRRDQAINPKTGYRIYLQAEYASKRLGGEVDYQRVEWGAAYHLPLSPERWLHAGLTQGAVLTLGANPYVPPPLNKLYYPGGDNSIRGYSEGEATPRAADGSFLGAKTYTLLNLEFEQALTQQWSVVVFYDSLLESARIGDYPGDVNLNSVGLGLRYRTIVGPIRVEYGRNLNPRAQDAGGTWHISVGYPF
jgi:outer membrane protein assembly complex protein YaeT